MLRNTLLALFAVFVSFLVYELDVFKKVDSNLDCTNHFSDVMYNSEDLVHLGDKTYLVSMGDLHNLFFYGPSKTHEGEVYAVTLNPENADAPLGGTPRLLPREGWPEGKPFQPHGMFYSNATNRLLVLSHTFQPLGPPECPECGSFVEIFEVLREPLRLKYIESITSELFGTCVINDVVEGRNADEMFITTWLWYPKPMNGSKNPMSIKTFLQQKASLLALFTKQTHLIRCLRSSDSWSCSIARDAGYAHQFNGIAINTKRDTIFTVDSVARKFYQYTITPKGALVKQREIETPHMIDNIDYVHGTGDLVLGSIPVGYKALSKLERDPHAIVPGGYLRFEGSEEKGYTLAEDLVHDGTALSMISMAQGWGDYVLLGSPNSHGIATCKRRRATPS